LHHYGTHAVWRVPKAGHGKGRNTQGKQFAVCGTRQTAHGKQRPVKRLFAVGRFSGTWQSICYVPRWPMAKKKSNLFAQQNYLYT